MSRVLNKDEISRISKRKFTDEQIRDIRRRYSEGETQKSLSLEFGCSREPIYKIVHRKSYQHVE